MPAALVLANRDDADPGLVGEALVTRGYRLTTLAREDDAAAWRAPVPAEVDLVVVLGSEWSVYADAVEGPVRREQAFVARAVDQGVPVLAICFGAQLLAAALGGQVAPAGRTELGWLEVQPVDAGLDGDSRGESHRIAIERGPWFQFHGDAFTVPPGGTELARSDVGPQAFSAGSALGVQFHPEVTPDIVGRWAASDPEPVARAGFAAAELVARTAAEQPRARAATARLVDAFLAATP